MISPAAKPQPPLDRCRRRSKSRPRYWELHGTELTFATYSAIGGLPALEPSVDLAFLVKFLSAGAMHRCGNECFDRLALPVLLSAIYCDGTSLS
jgi:hypothetical protein